MRWEMCTQTSKYGIICRVLTEENYFMTAVMEATKHGFAQQGEANAPSGLFSPRWEAELRMRL